MTSTRATTSIRSHARQGDRVVMLDDVLVDAFLLEPGEAIMRAFAAFDTEGRRHTRLAVGTGASFLALTDSFAGQVYVRLDFTGESWAALLPAWAYREA